LLDKTDLLQCIDQKNPDQKHIQISNMDQIYSGAALVIIAAAGGDPQYGLPGVSKRARQPQRILDAKSCKLVELYPNLTEDIGSSRWATRAW
jgi:hypothetical protein|tara:strand:- start:4063 stop:4338 length:276 start_codon:yes stop_codon:yes gene_type:complete